MIRCVLENGRETSFRHVTVGSIVVNQDGKILLTRRAKHLLNGGKLTIPGGFLDRDENTKEGALRELQEETGLSGMIKSLFRINDNPNRPKEDRQNVDFIYLVFVADGELKENDEVSEFKWIDKNSIPEDSEFAFDHRDSIMKYFEYLKKPFPLPIIG